MTSYVRTHLAVMPGFRCGGPERVGAGRHRVFFEDNALEESHVGARGKRPPQGSAFDTRLARDVKRDFRSAQLGGGRKSFFFFFFFLF